ncbi:internalin-A [Kordia sp. SMS9]|uniref:leucine-rich repeat domain-containing protein n=1 Tax=Kordia sp. SMS9 TaxID=2282170 RepID=UPI000E0D7CFA|nr:COR domain-containing protein [Kordia sp. SMS9]AXG69750.1 internalin-A [Kordia sp. SMS9]
MEKNYKGALRRIRKVKKNNSKGLDLSGFKLTEIPKEVFELTHLTEIDLRYNQITEIPEAIGKLTNLYSLFLHDNQITEIPAAIGNLTNLKDLNLGRNQISEIPTAIGKLTNLKDLNLVRNQISEIPTAIGKLTNLTTLDLSVNQITEIPVTIGKLSKLTGLGLSRNQITEIPEAIGKLTKLTILYLRNNKLISIPESLKKLTNLRDVDLKGNQFKVGSEVYQLPPQEQIQAILTWQHAQQSGTLEPIHEAKVIFIGESNFGKTHLIEFLKEGKIKREIKTTHGIERRKLAIPYPEKDIQLNIWDLGGQEFMRSTHQFFFSERTLYVLVTLARRERNELNHWLKLVNQLGKKAPVLVVINKIDLNPHDIDRLSLERDYPNIKGFIRTCIKDCPESNAEDTLKTLKQRIISIVSDPDIMPSVFEQRPPDWFAVKNELEKLEANGKDFITYAEYEKLDFIKKLPEDERKINLKLLSMIGAVVSFVDDPRLIDTNVINPQWIMDGVYAIINDPQVKDEAKGQLHINDLGRILPKDKFPTERHAYLLELMEKFNLCYPAKEQRDLYFIPDLFDDVEPEATWNEDDVSIQFRYNYDDFSPDAFMTRFIVEMHQDIQEDKRWRSGVYISNGTCQAKVYQAYSKNYIRIEITGYKGEGRSYLYTIRDRFRKLHKTFSEIQITEEVYYKTYWHNYEELTKLEKVNETKYHTQLEERLPITDILNGYTSTAERKGNLKIIKIFLASSYELKTEREQFALFINRENNRLIEDGIFLKLELWEDFIDVMDRTRLQNAYNIVIKNADIFVSLFSTKVGMFTLEEFETAFGQFQATGKPFIYTYFKNTAINMEDLNKKDFDSLHDFKEKLKALGHFRTVYKNTEDLHLQFKRQLDKVLPRLLQI